MSCEGIEIASAGGYGTAHCEGCQADDAMSLTDGPERSDGFDHIEKATIGVEWRPSADASVVRKIIQAHAESIMDDLCRRNVIDPTVELSFDHGEG